MTKNTYLDLYDPLTGDSSPIDRTRILLFLMVSLSDGASR